MYAKILKNKRSILGYGIIMLIVLAIMLLTGVQYALAATAWDGTTVDSEFAGEGTADNPYLITSAAELAGLAANVNGGTVSYY